MTEEDAALPASREQRQRPETSSSVPSRRWFRLPAPLRRVFDNFPLVSYSANEIPQRTTRSRNEHVLYLFKSARGDEGPSWNPSCLKYQAYLKFRGIPFRCQSSNNHASPTGALPFVLPASNPDSRPGSPVAANKIIKWVVSQGTEEDIVLMKEEAYMSLIDHTIRNAWLHYLYIDQHNFQFVARPLYVETTSANAMIQQAISHQLKSAAQEELLKTSALIDAGELYENADQALQALSTVLGEDQYFFGAGKPGLFDASLFAYTHPILETSIGWRTTNLTSILEKYDNLVQHRDVVLNQYFGT